MQRPGIEPTIYRSRVQLASHYTTEPPQWDVKLFPLPVVCCSGGAGARGTRGQMSGRGGARGSARGGGPPTRGRGAPATGSMVPPAAPSYGTEGYNYVRYTDDNNNNNKHEDITLCKSETGLVLLTVLFLTSSIILTLRRSEPDWDEIWQDCS